MKDIYRLGPYRRNCRDYSVHQRATGKNAGHRMMENSLKQIMHATLFLSNSLNKRCRELDDEVLIYDQRRRSHNTLLLSFAAHREIEDLNVPHFCIPDTIIRRDVNFNSFTEQQFTEKMGLSKQDAMYVFDVLNVPAYFVLNAGDANSRWRVSGVHSFLYFCYRMRSPAQRQSLDAAEWGYDYSVLSKMFSAVVDYIDTQFSHRLHIIPECVGRFPMFNRCIIDKIHEICPGEDIPPEAERCALFTDGSRYRTSCPSGGWFRQAAAFNGDKWFHCHGVQGCMGPDGIFYDLFDGPVGRHDDQHFMNSSDINAILRDCQLGDEYFYWLYTDKGYTANTHVYVAYHGQHVTPLQIHRNWIMLRERIGVEWGFGKVRARCPFVTRPSLLKLGEIDVARLIRVAFILTNIHTCLHQSSCGLYFNCKAPQVTEYLFGL